MAKKSGTKTYTIVKYVPYMKFENDSRRYIKEDATWDGRYRIGSNYIPDSAYVFHVRSAMGYFTKEEAEQFCTFYRFDGIEVYKEIVELY